MADQQLSAAKRFQMYVSPNLSDNQVSEAFYNDTDRQRISQAYKKALSSGNTADMQRVISDVANRIVQPNETFDSVFDSIQREVPLFGQTEPTAQPGQAQPSELQLPGFLQRNKKPNPSEGIHVGNSTAPVVRSIQEQQLLLAYEKALNIQNTNENPTAREDAIRKILERLEAPALLEDQWNTINGRITSEDALRALQAQKEGQIQKHKLFLDSEEGKKAKEEGDRLKEKVLAEAKKAADTGDTTSARQAFQGLLNRRQDEIESYSVQIEDEGDIGELLLYNIAKMLEPQLEEAQVNRLNYLRSLQAVAAQEEEQQEANQENRRIDTANRLRKTASQNLRGRAEAGAKKAVKKEVKKLVLSSIKKKLVQGAAREFIIWLFSPAAGFAGEIIVAVLIGIIILIAIIIGVWFFLTQTGNGPTGSTPQDVSILRTVVIDIEVCERTSVGGWHPPTPLCLIELRLGNLFSGININLQGFLDDVNSQYPRFQCGQFVWSAQKRILNWPPFPGNVGSVYQWYTLYPGHVLPGYDWVANPDNPGLIADSRLRNQLLRANELNDPANILPGDIILYGSTGGNDPGHIAIVSTVQSDRFNISVMEANYHSGAIDLRPTNLNDGLGRGAYVLGWWRLKPKIAPTAIPTP